MMADISGRGKSISVIKETRGWFSLPDLHTTIEKYVPSKAESLWKVLKLSARIFMMVGLLLALAKPTNLKKTVISKWR